MLLNCGVGKDSTVPWTARRSNQSILKETIPEYFLEGLMLKLKLQYFVHLMRRTDSLEKTLMLGKIEGGKRRGRQRMRWLDGITNSMDILLLLLLSCSVCPTLCNSIVGSPPGSPVPGIPRQEHWSGLPLPSPMHESEK